LFVVEGSHVTTVEMESRVKKGFEYIKIVNDISNAH
jgi:hypothetical protein